jgi:hypothetical protein
MRRLFLIFLIFTFVNTCLSQGKWMPDLGLSMALPLPGEHGGYIMSVDKDPVIAIILLPGEDATGKILPAESSEKASSLAGDIAVMVLSGHVAAVDVGKMKVDVGFSDYGGTGNYNIIYKFRSYLESGRVIRLNEGYLIVPIADAKTKLIVKKLRYDFGKNATISWDKENREIVWRGFSVKVE